MKELLFVKSRLSLSESVDYLSQKIGKTIDQNTLFTLWKDGEFKLYLKLPSHFTLRDVFDAVPSTETSADDLYHRAFPDFNAGYKLIPAPDLNDDALMEIFNTGSTEKALALWLHEPWTNYHTLEDHPGEALLRLEKPRHITSNLIACNRLDLDYLVTQFERLSIGLPSVAEEATTNTSSQPNEIMGQKKESTYLQVIAALCKLIASKNSSCAKTDGSPLVGYVKDTGNSGIVGALIAGKLTELASSTLEKHISTALKTLE